MNALMSQRIRRAFVAIVSAQVVGSLAACAHVINGSPTYASDIPTAELPLVKIVQLPDLIPTAAEIGAVVKAPQLATVVIYTKLDTLPVGTLSDPKCIGAMTPAAEPPYRGSGYQAVYGRLEQDPTPPVLRNVNEAVAVFGSAEEAQRFVSTQINRWKDCSGRTLTVELEQPPVNWVISVPTRSDGVAVLLRRQEGGQGYACSRGMAARSNIVADVVVCSLDEDAVTGQAGALVNMILARIPK